MQFLFAFFLSVVHCRCSKCYSVPARKRVRKRSSGITLLSLPEEVLLCVLQYLSAEDLLSIRAVSKSAHSDTAKLFITWDFSSAGVLIIIIIIIFLNACFRFTLSCGTLLTTTLVFGPGSVSETRGHPQTHYGFLKGTPPTVKSVLIYMLFVNLSLYFKFCLPLELLTKGILKLLWSLELHIYTMKDVSCWLVHVRD